jgi:hypothetical protein
VPHPQSRQAKIAKAKRKQARTQSNANHPGNGPKQHEREQRRAEARAARRRKDRLGRLRSVGIVGVPVAVLLFGGWLMFGPSAELAGVERPPADGRGHVDAASYRDGSPTSGAHSGAAPGCNVYSSPLPKDLAVHGLEHGTVVLWYDINNPDLGSELSSLMANWESHVIVSPSSELDAPIVATAWNRRMQFSEVSADVDAFIETYRNRGPEKVPCDIA